MLFLHVSKTFQHRMAEWLLAAIITTWGGILLMPDQTFDLSAAYAALEAIAPERTWGIFCLLVGTIRFAALAVNGHWTPPTYWLRSMMSGASTFSGSPWSTV